MIVLGRVSSVLDGIRFVLGLVVRGKSRGPIKERVEILGQKRLLFGADY